ncbi:MAG: YhgN family NAAT transporter [Zetaproteobacteria bacterium]|nr:YhgN family NAAT transporter [Zetaproteobacteria bacterium]
MEEMFSAGLTLFFVMDPLGNLPIFLSVLGRIPQERRKIVLARELAIAFVIMLVFLLLGQHFLDLFGLKTESVSVGGGIVLFLISLKMIFPAPPNEKREVHNNRDEEPFLVPLAVPLLAGPSTLAILLLMQARQTDTQWYLFGSLLMAWSASALILWSSGLLVRLLKVRGLIALERLMGMILVTLATQMILDGLKSFFS